MSRLNRAIASKAVTYDFARQMEGATEIKCPAFGDNIIAHLLWQTWLSYTGEPVLTAVTMLHRVTLRWHKGGHSDIKPTAKLMILLLASFRKHGVEDEKLR